MADRKIVIEVTDGDTIDKVLNKIAQANAALDKTKEKAKTAFNIGGSVAAGNAGAQVGLGDDRTLYNRARSGAGTGAEGRDFSKQAQGLGGLVHVYATFAANLFAVGAAFRALKDAMDTSIMVKSMDVLSTSVGTNLKSIAKEMEAASQGAISLKDSMKFTAMAATAGFTAKNIRDLTDAAKGASSALGRDLNDSMDRLFRGVVKMEPELLDELGIMTKANDAYRAYASVIGKSAEALSSFEKRQAFLNAVITEAKSKFQDTAKALEVNPYTKLLASLQNSSTQILGVLNGIFGPIAKLFSENSALLSAAIYGVVLLLLRKAIPALGEWGKAVKATTEENNKAFEKTAARLKASQETFVNLQTARANNKFDSQLGEFQNADSQMLRKLQNNVALAFKKGVVSGAVEAAPSTSKALEAISLSGAISAQKAVDAKLASGNYSGEKLEDLNIKKRAIAEVIAFKKNEVAINKQLEESATKLAQIETDKIKFIEQNAGKGLTKVNAKIDAAQLSKDKSNAFLTVQDIQTTNGMVSAFQALNIEMAKFRGTASADFVGPMQQRMTKLGGAIFYAQGAVRILGTALVGLASSINMALGVIGIFYLVISSIAAITGGYSEKIEALSNANTDLADTLKITNSVLKDRDNALKTGYTNLADYMKGSTQVANATSDLAEKIGTATQKLREYSNSSGGWFTSIVEAAKGLVGLDEKTKYIKNLSEALKKAKELNPSTNFGGISELAATGKTLEAADALEAVLKRQGELGKIRVSQLETELGLYKEIQDRITKEKTEQEKLIDQKKQLAKDYSERVNRIQNAGLTDDKATIVAELQTTLKLFTAAVVERMGEEGKNARAALINALNGDISAKLDSTLASENAQKLKSLAVEYNAAGTSPEGKARIASQMQTVSEKIFKDIEASIKAAEADGLKGIALDAYKGVFTVLMDSIKNTVSNAKDFAAPDKKGMVIATDVGAAARAASLNRQSTTNAIEAMGAAGKGVDALQPKNDNTKIMESEVKLLQLREAGEKRVTDELKKQFDLLTNAGVLATQEELDNFRQKSLEAINTQYSIALKEIALEQERNKGYPNAVKIAKARTAEASAQLAANTRLLDVETKKIELENKVASMKRATDDLTKAIDFETKKIGLQEISMTIDAEDAARKRSVLAFQKDQALDLLRINSEIAKIANSKADNKDELLKKLAKELELQTQARDIEMKIAAISITKKQLEDNLNTTLENRLTILNNAASTNLAYSDGLLVQQQITQQIAELSEQTVNNLNRQLYTMGSAATESQKQLAQDAARVTLQEKILKLMESEVLALDKAGDAASAFSAKWSLEMTKAKQEVKGLGEALASGLSGGVDKAVDTFFTALKGSGKGNTLKEVFKSFGNAFRDTIFDSFASNLKSNLKSALGEIFGIEDAATKAKRLADEQIAKYQEIYTENNSQLKALGEALKAIVDPINSLTDALHQVYQSTSGLTQTEEEAINAAYQEAAAKDNLIGAIEENSAITSDSSVQLMETINVFASSLSSVTGGKGGASGSSGIGGIAKTLSNGFNIFSKATSAMTTIGKGISSVGTFIGSSTLQGFGAGMAGVPAAAVGEAAIAQGVGVAGSQTAAAAGNMLAAAGPYIAAALAVYAIYQALKKPGGPKTGGSNFTEYDPNGKMTKTQYDRFFTPNQSDAEVQSTGAEIAKGYYGQLIKLGGKAKGSVGFGIGFDSDPNGTAPNRVSSSVTVDGKQVYYNRDRDIGRDSANIPTQIKLEASRSILAALQASELPTAISKILNSVVASAATQEQIDQVMANAEDAKRITDTLKSSSIVGLTLDKIQELNGVGETLGQTFDRVNAIFLATSKIADKAFGKIGIDSLEMRAALIDAAGGFDIFLNAYKDYYDKFTSSGQKFQDNSASLNQALNSLGLDSIPQTKNQFTTLMNSLDLTTESGRNMYVGLLKLAPAFDDVVGAIERANQEISKITQSSLDTILLDTLDEKGKYDFWKKKAEELAAGASFKDLMSPEEVTKQITDSTNAAMNAWNNLDEAGKKNLKSYFETFFKDLDANAKSRLGELSSTATAKSATLETTAASIATATTNGAVTIATAFDLGSQAIASAITNSVGGGSGAIDNSKLADFIAEQNAKNAAAQSGGVAIDLSGLTESMETMKATMEEFKQSVAIFTGGANSIRETADTPLNLNLRVDSEGTVKQVNM